MSTDPNSGQKEIVIYVVYDPSDARLLLESFKNINLVFVWGFKELHLFKRASFEVPEALSVIRHNRGMRIGDSELYHEYKLSQEAFDDIKRAGIRYVLIIP